MAGDISIKDFRQDVQDYINRNGLDINKDSLINKDNGELANLLSASGVDDVSKLYNSGRLRSKYTNIIIGSTITGAGIAYAGQKMTSHEVFVNTNNQYYTQLKEANKIIEQYNNSCQQKKPDFWNETLKTLRANVAKDVRYTAEQREGIIQTIDDVLKERKDIAHTASAEQTSKQQVVNRLKQLHKPPFLLRARNLIRNGSLIGVGLSIASALFFGYKAATTTASTEKLAFE